MTQDLYRHLLDELQPIVTHMGFKATLVPQSAAIAQDVLVVTISPDKQQRDRSFTLTFFPVSQSDLPNTLLLQFFFRLPFKVNSEVRTDLQRLILALNGQVPVGSYGMNEQEGLIYCRYILPLLRSPSLSQPLMVDTMTLFIYVQDLFPPLLEALNQEQVSLQDAMHMIGIK